MSADMRIASGWHPIDPERAASLVDARLQVHHAAQLATAFGISYLPSEADDSHTNLEWLPRTGALASREKDGVRIWLRVAELVLEVGGTPIELRGATTAEAVDRVRAALHTSGLDPSGYTLDRHYELPAHPVTGGGRFDAEAEDLAELARWFANGHAVLEGLRAREPRASEVRCWPHHFDIATLIKVGPGRTIGVGLEMGDQYYVEPYFYVNMRPAPKAARVESLELWGGGSWHTEEWVGAVLPGSRLSADGDDQVRGVLMFLESAVAAAESLVR